MTDNQPAKDPLAKAWRVVDLHGGQGQPEHLTERTTRRQALSAFKILKERGFADAAVRFCPIEDEDFDQIAAFRPELDRLAQQLKAPQPILDDSATAIDHALRWFVKLPVLGALRRAQERGGPSAQLVTDLVRALVFAERHARATRVWNAICLEKTWEASRLLGDVLDRISDDAPLRGRRRGRPSRRDRPVTR